MPRKEIEPGMKSANHKILVNVGETRHEWLTRVIGITGSSQTSLVNMLLDEAMIQDVENFAMKVDKAKAKAELEELDREERAIQAKRATLLTSMQASRATEKAHR